MTLTRRKTLALLGGGAVVAATAGAGFAVTRTPGTAHLPWSRAGDYADPRKKGISTSMTFTLSLMSFTWINVAGEINISPGGEMDSRRLARFTSVPTTV